MRRIQIAFTVGAVLWAAPLSSQEAPEEVFEADIIFLGEVHDNPEHHDRQANWVSEIAPKAVVFEMLPVNHPAGPLAFSNSAEAAEALNWAARGWPDFAMYWQVFDAAPTADIYGAGVDRTQLMALQEAPLSEAFGADAARFRLDQKLPEDEQSQREAGQALSHCNALPPDILPLFVDMQRWRDAALARAALQALDDTGGPVVVIAGNGHARQDWGAPAMLPSDINVFTLGQVERGTAYPPATFDMVMLTDPVDRSDPCDAFR